MITYQVIEDTFIELPLIRPALPELLVIIIEAGPVLSELLKAVFVNIWNAESDPSAISSATFTTTVIGQVSPDGYPKLHLYTRQVVIRPDTLPIPNGNRPSRKVYSHALRTSRNSSPLLQTLQFASSGILILALPKIIIKSLASCSNEKAGR